eukprot:CAMPEP_0116876922 /NCGR_PEP_ID=MMETSP0463-20121206/8777_1 /TAXON_ID=181622 /ORGANISM="Strombidinopsis sp, Strain SopsisLIS2011" /LENGTH=123 /DNA_ID=CAMNT_0004523837 /DNA_START=1247 /DNA_END=1618 /DNA_ORIENTATION=-
MTSFACYDQINVLTDVNWNLIEAMKDSEKSGDREDEADLYTAMAKSTAKLIDGNYSGSQYDVISKSTFAKLVKTVGSMLHMVKISTKNSKIRRGKVSDGAENLIEPLYNIALNRVIGDITYED